jgi:hypothetical protein
MEEEAFIAIMAGVLKVHGDFFNDNKSMGFFSSYVSTLLFSADIATGISSITDNTCEFNAACNSSVKLRGAAVLFPRAKTTAS